MLCYIIFRGILSSSSSSALMPPLRFWSLAASNKLNKSRSSLTFEKYDDFCLPAERWMGRLAPWSCPWNMYRARTKSLALHKAAYTMAHRVSLFPLSFYVSLFHLYPYTSVHDHETETLGLFSLPTHAMLIPNLSLTERTDGHKGS